MGDERSLYASVFNHIDKIAHYLFGFCVLYILFPRLLFGRGEGDALDVFFRNFIKSVMFFIIAGYLLIVVKLYEFIGIVLLVITAKLFFANRRKSLSESGKQLSGNLNTLAFDLVDGKKNLKALDLTKAMIKKFGDDECDKKLCKKAIRSLMDSGRCTYSYVGGSYIVLPPDKD